MLGRGPLALANMIELIASQKLKLEEAGDGTWKNKITLGFDRLTFLTGFQPLLVAKKTQTNKKLHH